MSGLEQEYKGKVVAENLDATTPDNAKLVKSLGFDNHGLVIRDANGKYHGFRTRDVTYKLDAPAEAHAELLGKYTDADIHNLMAYLQSLK